VKFPDVSLTFHDIPTQNKPVLLQLGSGNGVNSSEFRLRYFLTLHEIHHIVKNIIISFVYRFL